MKIKIILVDDHKILREGICSLVKGFPDMEVVGEAVEGRSALRLVEELSPDVVIMDISMPVVDGIEATRLIHKQNPEIKIVILSMYSNKHFLVKVWR
ncbi:MAG: response regulator transcription factor, partial [Thermodesulfovibrionia bacterium]|nr:response regulator transcription factor [Thermodesulfovibrionia bacterium]